MSLLEECERLHNEIAREFERSNQIRNRKRANVKELKKRDNKNIKIEEQKSQFCLLNPDTLYCKKASFVESGLEYVFMGLKVPHAWEEMIENYGNRFSPSILIEKLHQGIFPTWKIDFKRFNNRKANGNEWMYFKLYLQIRAFDPKNYTLTLQPILSSEWISLESLYQSEEERKERRKKSALDVVSYTYSKRVIKFGEPWKIIKLLFIGYSKDDSSYCNFALLPKEIVKEIIKFLS